MFLSEEFASIKYTHVSPEPKNGIEKQSLLKTQMFSP
jgi:hypothetical protein